MSLPTDSVAPAPPTGTSNPWSLVQWWKRITDWIAALSPSGADVYDTGWVDVAGSITPGTGWTISAAMARRIGSLAYLYVQATATATHALTAATGAIADNTLGTIAAAWRPTPNISYALAGTNSRAASGVLTNSGLIAVTGVVGTGNIVSPQVIRLGGVYPIG